MKLWGPLTRATVLAGIVLGGGLAPAYAGPSEVALLAGYVGSWKGTGKLSGAGDIVEGAKSETVVCRMAVSTGKNDKFNLTGRCSMAGTVISVTGTIAYIEDRNRYEAVMNSGMGGFRGVAIGQKSGSKIIFDLQERAKDEAGNAVDISSRVVLSGDSMDVSFHAAFKDSGDVIDAKIPFEKA